MANEDIRRNTTPAYRSPEQVDLFQGHVISEKVDIWALGVILFKLACFQTPFEDSKGNVDAKAILNGLGDRRVGGVAQGRASGGGVLLLAGSGVCCLCD